MDFLLWTGVPLSVGLVVCALARTGANITVKIAASDSPNMTEDLRLNNEQNE
jgi:hypothetical protein